MIDKKKGLKVRDRQNDERGKIDKKKGVKSMVRDSQNNNEGLKIDKNRVVKVRDRQSNREARQTKGEATRKGKAAIY